MYITVLIPSWNSAAYIARVLDSILATGYEDLEVLVMDNQSTDGTDKIVTNYKDKRIHYIAKKDAGMYEALNRGIKQAKGEIICWLGADDQYEKYTFQKVTEAFADPKVQWVTGEGTFLYEGGTEIFMRDHHLPTEVGLKDITKGNPLISPSVFFRKTFFDETGGFDEQYKLAADYDLWIRFASKSTPTIVRHSLSIFSYNGNNESSKNKIKMYQETIHILKRLNLSLLWGERQFNLLRMNAYIAYNRVKKLFRI